MIFGETIEHLKATKSKNAHGQTIITWEPNGPIRGCSVQAPSTVEAVDGTTLRVKTSWTVYMPHATVLGTEDRLVIRGKEFDVVGLNLPEISSLTGRRALLQVEVEMRSS